MFKTPSFKLVLVLFLSLLLMIPILMVQNKTADRAAKQNEAQYSIGQHWTGRQWLGTAIIAIPYYNKLINQNGFSSHSEQQWLLIPPESNEIQGRLEAENRKKGIYEIPVYRSDFSLQSSFKQKTIETALNRLAQNPQVEKIGTPIISLSLADMRGLEKQSLEINGKSQLFKVGSKLDVIPQGLHSPLDSDLSQFKKDDLSVNIKLSLKGMNDFHFWPMGKQNSFTLSSNWPHPKFTGAQLPVKYDIADTGFSADWSTNHFALNGLDHLEACLKESKCYVLENNNRLLLGVEFINPVDVYLKTERSLKYAFLLIGLSFMVFFIIEHIRALAMHPIQYGFVGLSIATFYLLLLALSEHLGFATAYLIATLACAALLLSYLTKALKSTPLGAGFTGGMVTLWAVLYIIIQAEDFALLMGSFLVFFLLSILMVGTRSLDWYALGKDKDVLTTKTTDKDSPKVQLETTPQKQN